MVLQGVLKRVFKGDLEGYLEEDLEVDYEGNSKWDCIGDFKLDLEGVWFILQLKFNSLELDFEVGRLVLN